MSLGDKDIVAKGGPAPPHSFTTHTKMGVPWKTLQTPLKTVDRLPSVPTGIRRILRILSGGVSE